MSVERTLKQFEEDRKEAARIAARLLLASSVTSPRVGGVGECTCTSSPNSRARRWA